MDVPNLNRIVETYIPVVNLDLALYLGQLRRDVLRPIRNLQANSQLRWFSFLLHGTRHVPDSVSDSGFLIHIRLEPATGIDIQQFISGLPSHFQKPRHVNPLSNISGLEGSDLHDNDWSLAWRLLGECSEWILTLLETHDKGPTLQQIIQFLHFFTNPLMLGKRCIYTPGRLIF